MIVRIGLRESVGGTSSFRCTDGKANWKLNVVELLDSKGRLYVTVPRDNVAYVENEK